MKGFQLPVRRAAICFVAALILSAGTARAVPVVSSVTALQRGDGSGLVDINYNLSGGVAPMLVTILLSSNNGASYNIVPSLLALSGDVGAGITNGNGKHIVWDAVLDQPEVFWPQARVRVTASELGFTQTFLLNGVVPIEMVQIPAGNFTMGSANDGFAGTDEFPAHEVNIPTDFFIGKFEVTQQQWTALMPSNPSSTIGPTLPVQSVSWDAAQLFVTALNAQGFAGTFSLPSEAEWEYAARGGTSTRYSFGDSNCLTSECASACDLGSYSFYCQNSANTIHAVGGKLANAFGLFDNMGNVFELVQDVYHATFDGAPTDGSAWVLPASTTKVMKGGAYNSAPAAARPSERVAINQAGTGSVQGLRVRWRP